MRFPVVLVWLCATLEVLASNTAAPFELLWLYSIYKSEWHVNGKSGSRSIATGCTHDADNWATTDAAVKQQNDADEAAFVAAAAAAGITGICTFDEFVKHVGTKASFAKYKYDSIGHTLDPDWNNLKTKFKSAIIGSSPMRYDFKTLFPGKWDSATKVSWALAIDTGTTLYQEVRAAAAAGDAFITKEVTNAKEWIRVAHQIRLSDRAVNLMVDVTNFINSIGDVKTLFPAGMMTKPYKVIKPFTTTGQMIAYKDFDTEASIKGTKKNPSTLSEDQKNDLRSTVANFATSSTIAIEHQDVIDSMHESTNLLDLDVAGCAVKGGVPRRKRNTKKPRHRAQRHLRQMLAGFELVGLS
ncbi:hypothetical protein AB5N19_06907 [Seiridium cardinale]|uniref:Uncharacterized protein n=1 Tax=Seiridium cardinale TaxID=138064 RepID=A0ABR2XJW4_9PEZI